MERFKVKSPKISFHRKKGRYVVVLGIMPCEASGTMMKRGRLSRLNYEFDSSACYWRDRASRPRRVDGEE